MKEVSLRPTSAMMSELGDHFQAFIVLMKTIEDD
jgi:hypothetical protein